MRSKQEKDALCRMSVEQGLGVSSMYPSSVQHIVELRDSLAFQNVPQSLAIAERLVTLPTHELLSDADLVRICATVQSIQRAQRVGTTSSPGDYRRAASCV